MNQPLPGSNMHRRKSIPIAVKTTKFSNKAVLLQADHLQLELTPVIFIHIIVMHRMITHRRVMYRLITHRMVHTCSRVARVSMSFWTARVPCVFRAAVTSRSSSDAFCNTYTTA